MESVSTFLSMGGYGRFVWSAYGVAAVVLAGLLIQSLRSARAHQRELDQLQDLRRSGREARR